MATVLPGEIKGTYTTSNTDEVLISITINLTLIEREDIPEKQLALFALQSFLDFAGLFPAEAPKFDLPPRQPLSDWSFTVRCPVLKKPVLVISELVSELQNSLHEEDLTSMSDCRRRLLELVQSKVETKLPQSYLDSTDSPIQSIEVWRTTLANAALADLINENIPRAERTEKAIELILKNAVEPV